MAISGVGNHNLYSYVKNKEVKNSDSSDYSDYLSKKYDCVKNGNVVISKAYLKECAENPDKAKELEESLSFYKESCQSGYANAKANANMIGAKLMDYSETWSIDSTGNITMIASTTVTSGDNVKGWKEQKEEQTKRLAEKQEQKLKEKREEQKQIQQTRIAKGKKKGNINFKI